MAEGVRVLVAEADREGLDERLLDECSTFLVWRRLALPWSLFPRWLELGRFLSEDLLDLGFVLDAAAPVGGSSLLLDKSALLLRLGCLSLYLHMLEYILSHLSWSMLALRLSPWEVLFFFFWMIESVSKLLLSVVAEAGAMGVRVCVAGLSSPCLALQ